MTKNELIDMANNGDVEAMLQLADIYVEEQDWNAATDWADKAAKTFDVDGLYKAAMLHDLRVSIFMRKGLPFWLALEDEIRAVKEDVGILIEFDNQGMLELDAAVCTNLRRMQREALYGEAIAAYYKSDDESEHEKVVQLLKDANGSRERTLWGLCCFTTKRYDDAIHAWKVVCDDEAYTHAKKTPYEERCYAVAMVVFSELTRREGNIDKAVSILKNGITAVSDEGMKESLWTEVRKYQRSAFGGWKYVG